MQYVYGPVPSRRLGQSLGIDPLPAKTCNWNCLYCQLGRTAPVTNHRQEFFPPEAILEEVQTTLAGLNDKRVDWITFVGSGEPTLYRSLGRLIRGVQELTDIPIAVITNGSFLYDPNVRAELSQANAVMPTLDAGTQRLYRKINRPHPDFTFRRHTEGLLEFRKVYEGQLWPEVMLIKGLNDTREALTDIAKVLEKARPDEIHLSLPERPPAEARIFPADRDGIMRATAILGSVAHVLSPAVGRLSLEGGDNLGDTILGVITRHPMRDSELREELDRIAPGRGNTVLAQLLESGRAQTIDRHGVTFWSPGEARYGDAG